ncbi:MAG: alpha/beta hydrolase [Oscillospiraceae bacterium]|nr:alpha/beta hydrolase [Oscillospiraceae bacterium]
MAIFKKLFIIFLLFGIISASACSNGGENKTGEIEKTGQTYEKNQNENSAASGLPFLRPEKLQDLGEIYDAKNGLAFDIYYPTSIKYEKSPLLVAFHGGGWVMGDRSQIMDIFAPIIGDLRESGYTVATVQYRYAQQEIFPAQIRDCANAIQYMADNADKYGIDANSIGLMGYSAGAQLAMLAAYAPKGADFASELYDREYSFDIKYCLSFAAPTKMYGAELEDYPIATRYLLEWLFGGEYIGKEAEYMAGSPYFHISANTKKVPLFLAQDESDNVVPFSQLQAMYEKAAEMQIPCEMLVLSGVYHQIDFNYGYMRSPSTEEAAKTVLDFIRKYSGKGKK